MGYNGWTNYETWNVALWLGNDEGLYHLTRHASDWQEAKRRLARVGLTETPDGVSYDDCGLDEQELDGLFAE